MNAFTLHGRAAKMILLNERSPKSLRPLMKEGDRTKMKGNRPSLHRESIPIRSNKNPLGTAVEPSSEGGRENRLCADQA